MLAKNFRLKRQEIEYVLKKGRSQSSRLFIARYKENEENFPKYCVIISRKISKSAVSRNRARRQIFEAIRLINKEHPEQKALDLVLIPKKEILNQNFHKISENLKELFEKINTR